LFVPSLGTCLASQAFTPWKAWPDEDRERYKEMVLANFNAAVAENAMKWKAMEKNAGETDFRVADAMVEWATANDLRLRGHCVFWEVENHVPAWVQSLPDDELRNTLRARAFTLLARYRDSIDEWDVNNEMLHGSWFADRLGRDIWVEMFQWCREAETDFFGRVTVEAAAGDYEISFPGGATTRLTLPVGESVAVAGP